MIQLKNPVRFSRKQLVVLTWWSKTLPHKDCQAIVCDGAIRSGKTFAMMVSFLLWAQKNFSNSRFAICGKTIVSATRNLVHPMLPLFKSWGFEVNYNSSKNYFDVIKPNGFNRFYIFGGKDEAACEFIQGVTLAGVLFDEVVLLPQTFVNQAIARCSVTGSRLWFNCNPEGPQHWFFRSWIKSPNIKTLILHFTMDDNPALSQEIKNRYFKLYSGVFYKRFIKGEWATADSLVFQNFDFKKHTTSKLPGRFELYYVSCDYGITNPTSFGLWGLFEGVWHRVSEYYYDSKKTGIRKTDAQYYSDLVEFVGRRPVKAVIVDPSASSFIECIKQGGKFKVIKAQNNVSYGINLVGRALGTGQIMINRECKNTLREFSLYEWNKNSQKDEPKKQNDHAMDEIRYFVTTVLGPKPGRITAKHSAIIPLKKTTLG